MNKGGNFNVILNVLSALRQEDSETFEACLQNPESYTEKEIGDNLKKNGLIVDKKEYSKEELFKEYNVRYNAEKSELINFKRLSRKAEKNVQIINDKVNDKDIFVDKGFGETLYFIKKGDKYVKTKGGSNGKINKPHRNIKPVVYASDEIKVLWEVDGEINLNKRIFGGYIKCAIVKPNEEDWMIMLEKVKKYIDEHKKRPSDDNTDSNIKQMGKWVSHQIANYNRYVYIMKNNNIRRIWISFIQDYKKYFKSNEEIWYENLENVKIYINEYKKKPLTTANDNNIKKLGSWISTQIINYSKIINIMKNKHIKLSWELFIQEYNEYFVSNEEKWNNTLSKVKIYMNKYKKRPSNCDNDILIAKMGQWICSNARNYKNNKKIMKNQKIKLLWENFMLEYKIYFVSNGEVWNIFLEETKKYINKYKKRPSAVDKDNNIKRLGSWISNQKNNYDTNTNIMKKKHIKLLWENFMQEYSKYFIPSEDIWNDTLLEVKTYINYNKKRPSSHDSNNNIKRLGDWIRNQNISYNKNIHIMKNENIRSLWKNFICEYSKYLISIEEKWYNNFDEVKKYIDEFKKRPSEDSKDISIKKIGVWITCNIQSYKNNAKMMKNPEIKQSWEQFITAHQQYFPNNPAIQQPQQPIKKSTTITPKPNKPIETKYQHKQRYYQNTKK